MLNQQLELINEQTSALFRLMWIDDIRESKRRSFDNNICAFHIGNGFLLTVAHNLRTEAQLLKSFENSFFKNRILPMLNPAQLQLFNQYYPLDQYTDKRYLTLQHPAEMKTVMELFHQINFDTRWFNLMQNNCANPYLIIQFKDNLFYNNPELTTLFNNSTSFLEQQLNRQTFLLEVELVEAFYQEDIALYKIINTDPRIIRKLPKITPDFSILPDFQSNFYCIQSSPGSALGRLINKAQIEGYLDHHGTFGDRFGGNYSFEGLRYLIKGYFRFGSSGAPYVYYDIEAGECKVNAIQSEASPIQLSINNNREGNFQYVNAIASPLNSIELKLKEHLK